MLTQFIIIVWFLQTNIRNLSNKKHQNNWKGGIKVKIIGLLSKRLGFYIFSVMTISLTFITVSGATPIFFTNETNFQNAASAEGFTLTLEGFESLPDLTPAPFTVGNVSVIPLGTNLGTVFAPSPLATHGTHILGWNNGSPIEKEIKFSFNTPINAFGIDIIDLGDSNPPDWTQIDPNNPMPVSLQLIVDTGSQTLFSNFTGGDGNILFGGVIDPMTPFTTATFKLTTATGEGDFVAFDRLQSSPIPEPTTMLLFGSGLIGLAGFRRRFKKS